VVTLQGKKDKERDRLEMQANQEKQARQERSEVDDDWLNMTVKASDFKPGENPHICVNEQPDGVYEYYVKVETVGELDPRVRVLPK